MKTLHGTDEEITKLARILRKEREAGYTSSAEKAAADAWLIKISNAVWQPDMEEPNVPTHESNPSLFCYAQTLWPGWTKVEA